MRSASHFALHLALAGVIVLLSPLAAFAETPASHSKFAGAYESERPPANKPGPAMIMSLGRDGTATVTQDPGNGYPFTLFGHWVDSGSQVTVRFDPVDGQPTPAPMVFQPGHGGLQAVTWDHAAWGKLTPPPMKKAGDWHHADHRSIF